MVAHIHHNQRGMTLKAYREMKLKMLKEFCVHLTEEQREYMKSLKTEIAIDNFCISVIDNNIKTYA